MKSYLRRLAAGNRKSFGALMLALMFAFKIPFVPMIIALGGPGVDAGGVNARMLDDGLAVTIVMFLALPLETLFGQALPIWALRRMGVVRWRWLCLLSATFFGMFHLVGGPGFFFIGFAGGLSLSLAWLVWRETSFLNAFVGTTVVHVVHNAIAVILFLILAAFR